MKSFDGFSRIAFLASAVFLVFCAGLILAVLQLPPSGFVRDTIAVLKEEIRGPWLRDPKIVPRVYPGDGVTVHDAGATMDGLTLVQGMFENGAAIRLYDMSGRLVREWPMEFYEVWPHPTHVIPEKNLPKGKFNYHTQGLEVNPDGSIVVNFAEKGSAKFGACGGVEWTLDRMTHHAISRNPDGSFWIPVKLDPAAIDPADLIMGATVAGIMQTDNFYADAALLVSPDGEILREVPVLGPAIAWLAAHQDFGRFAAMKPADLDPLHLNDVEEVNAALAAKIDGVEPGDLLLSLRNLNALAIADPVSGEFKWMKSGPWIGQHDPDVMDDGTIEVFDNGLLRKIPGRDYAGSRILSFDATTGETRTVFPVSQDETFFSWIMGTHQTLPNGNRLIAETARGRVFEIDPAGKIVWSLVLPSSAKTAALIESAIRIPDGTIPADVWQCNGSTAVALTSGAGTAATESTQ